jgi:CheY-like chemotaxis protein
LGFSVRDTGIGIPAEKHGAIFDRFTQADSSTTRKYGGTGLGLAICKKFTALMGGRIWVESNPERGSTFRFTARFGIDNKAQPGGELAQDLSGVRALIVDDDATHRLIAKEMLSAMGIDAAAVKDGAAALSELSRANNAGVAYEIVLLDRDLPGMDGFTVANRIGSDPALALTKVILCVSSPAASDVARFQQLGVASLLKPIGRALLQDTLVRALGKSTASAAQAAIGPLAVEPHDKQSLRILLVDDTADNRKLIQAFLKSGPYAIETAEDGAMAVQKFIARDYDLVLMDMQMPVMDGYTATATIRAWESAQGKRPTPIVALTAHALAGDAEKSLQAGCTAHVTKPIKKPKLLQTIAQFAGGVEL